MVLYLIRHGQSFNNAVEDQSIDRVADPPLTELGQIQAERVAEYLNQHGDKADREGGKLGHGITQLYCSAMLRTLQTTLPIARSLNLAPTVWLDVHEVDGIWLDEGDGRGPLGRPGLGRSEIEARFSGFVLPEGVRQEGWWGELKETSEEMMVRVRRVKEEIGQRFFSSEERVAIVSHGGFMNRLIQSLLQDGGMEGVSFNNHNTAINRLDFIDGSLSVHYLNRVEHLSPQLTT